MDNPKIGFVGFGAVGNIFAKVMMDHGAQVCYHDVRGETAGYAGPVYLPLPELIETCDLIISTVVTNVALDAAQQVAAYLRPGKTFADFNSTSPSVKVQVSDIVTRTGANFVEGAILSPVGPARRNR